MRKSGFLMVCWQNPWVSWKACFIYFVGISLSSLLSPGSVFSEAKEGDIPRPSWKTAKITYATIDRMFDANQRVLSEEKGRKIRYTDTVHNRERVEYPVEKGFYPETMGDWKQQIVEIFDGKNTYAFDIVNKREGEGRYVSPAYGYPSRLGPRRFVWLDEEGPPNKVPVGAERIAGRMCDVYKMKIPGKGGVFEVTSWYWNGLLLKSEQKSESYFASFKAVAIQVGIPLAEDLFRLPEWYLERRKQSVDVQS